MGVITHGCCVSHPSRTIGPRSPFFKQVSNIVRVVMPVGCSVVDGVSAALVVEVGGAWSRPGESTIFVPLVPGGDFVAILMTGVQVIWTKYEQVGLMGLMDARSC